MTDPADSGPTGPTTNDEATSGPSGWRPSITDRRLFKLGSMAGIWGAIAAFPFVVTHPHLPPPATRSVCWRWSATSARGCSCTWA